MTVLALALAAGVRIGAATAQSALLDCAYAPRGAEMQSFGDCASKDAQGRLHLQPQHRARLTYARDGLASVYVEGWYYLTRDGSSAAVMAFDNGPDPFAEGLARAPTGGKIGYIDRHLRQVISARFDGAFPFEQGQAVVCVGCRATAEAEHSSYTGGEWGCIDHRGRLVVGWHAALVYAPCPPMSSR
jgi:WG repeat protein